ncbi:DUF3037 domain-containing protein [Vreelandella andesensis]|uniref:DUF3037 domain-containing protein n=1 Tax=Vreelandella andesensis TaxID=447567 RepID=A0A433KEL1_9GAMM|nr:DUF3037 domain-containing protein [Halomonas andesensis]RUR26704.1 DUF3037 domain-containing protein [Halomonas andesensis]
MSAIICNYAVLRFQPYLDTGEFANLGIIMLCNNGQFLQRVETVSRKRITHFFDKLPTKVFTQARQHFVTELKRTADLANHHKGQLDVQLRIFNDLVEPREAMFRFSKPGTLAAKDPQIALDELFNRYVHHDFKHIATPEEQLTKHVNHWLRALNRSYTEQTLGNDIVRVKLPFVWQEGAHIRQAIKPLSFDLEDAGRIIEKGDKWLAHLRRLKLSNNAPDDMVFISQSPKAKTGPRQRAYKEICQEIENDFAARILPEHLGQHRILKEVATPPSYAGN